MKKEDAKSAQQAPQDKAISLALEALGDSNSFLAQITDESMYQAEAQIADNNKAINLLSNIAREPVEQAHAVPLGYLSTKDIEWLNKSAAREINSVVAIRVLPAINFAPIYASPPPAPSMPTVCSPALTECPRCKNDISKCDGMTKISVSQSDTPPKELEQGRDDEEKELRSLLAHVYGKNLYTDDGELQDNSEFPCIDFKRFSVNQIRLAMRMRFENKLKEPSNGK